MNSSSPSFQLRGFLRDDATRIRRECDRPVMTRAATSVQREVQRFTLAAFLASPGQIPRTIQPVSVRREVPSAHHDHVFTWLHWHGGRLALIALVFITVCAAEVM